ncbi:pro-sigmaK processing inhibitor BofA family protein [Longirhabdus pacifica]|uniref:pro-sigmaK processing inhibitor BofA family protein n=1 Tax=Longirhabdus pacifica TaxID=2305227 RepID=UPI001008ED31|nr:pro-sigmaK processing inhibitor BofA family protein [Longirhabdus pacifica]
MNIPLFVFILASAVLLFILLRIEQVSSFLKIMVIQFFLSAVILVVLHSFEVLEPYVVAINVYTVTTIMVLGIPGLCMLVSIHLFII